MKIIEVLNFNEDAEAKIRKNLPHNVWTFFSCKNISMSCNSVCLTDDGDYKTLEEAREATTWLVEQLGGKVKWLTETK